MFRAALMKVPVVADPSTLAALSVKEALMLYESFMTELVDKSPSSVALGNHPQLPPLSVV